MISSLAVKVESLWGEVDVEDSDEAVGEEEPRLRLQRLPSAEPQGCYELRGWGEGHVLYTSVVVLFKYIQVYFVQVDKQTRKKTGGSW